MNKILPSTILILAWTIIVGLLLDSFTAFSGNSGGVLYIGLSLYLLAIGSLVFIKLPKYLPSKHFLYLTTSMSLLLLFIHTTTATFHSLGFFFLSLSPLLLYSFLYSFIQSKDRIFFLRGLFFLIFVALLSFIHFFRDFYPDFGILFLWSLAILLSYLTLKREKRLFFNPFNYKLLILAILGTFLPFLVSYLLNDFSPLTAILLISLPTCVTFILIKDQTLVLPIVLLDVLIVLFSSFLTTTILQLLGMSNDSFLATFLQIIFATSFTFFLIKKSQEIRVKSLQKQQRHFSKEKVELLNQVTYADFLHQASALLITRLSELTESENFLLLSEKQGAYITLCQKGLPIKQEVFKRISTLNLKSETMTIQEKSFQSLRIKQPENILWFFFEKTKKEVSDDVMIEFIQQYAVIIKTVQLLHDSQKKYIEASLNTSLLLQEKLFNSIQVEKTKQTHYLHDEVLQTIIALNTLVANLEGDLEIKQLITIEFSKLIYSIRQKIFDITPSTLYHVSFYENITILTTDFNQRYPETTFLFEHAGIPALPHHVIAPAYRIIKELNENIGKHAQGTWAKTTIQMTKTWLTILVQDDGIGIANFDSLEKELIQKREHIGLLSIKNDVNWLNGTFQLLPPSDSITGTVIQITIPLKEMENTDENTFN